MMLLQKILTVFGIVFLLSHYTCAQNPVSITLSTADNENKVYDAQSEINLLPGYEHLGGFKSMHAFIEQNTTYSLPYTTSTFNQSTINTSLEIGSSAGSHNVTNSGGSTYTMPIKIPSGTNGLVPNLSISYHSQQGDGIMGLGWNIAGLSAISVIPSAWYSEGKVENVALNSTVQKVFALDGSRLFATSGNYGANNTCYSTEIESYSKVISYTNGTTPTPVWFKVVTKDGITMEYGNTLDSKVLNDSRQILCWKVNKIYDTYGNYMTFEYTTDYNGSRISRILYTGNDNNSVAPYNVINFYYTARQDVNKSFVDGAEVLSSSLLNKIIITAEGELFKSYDFTYGLNDISFLQSVQEGGSDLTKLNSTIFKYGEKGLSFQTLSCSNFNGINADLQAARDFNGDGKTDLIVNNFVYNKAGLKVYTTWEVLTATTENSFTHYASGLIPSGYVLTFDPGNDEKLSGFASSFDFYGDGKDDLLLANINYASGMYTLNGLQIINISGVDQTSTYSPSISSGGYVMPDKFLQVADYDGNGKDEILVMRYGSSSDLSFYGIIISQENGVVGVNMGELSTLNSASKIYKSDFDGDGKEEIMAIYGSLISTCKFYEFSSNLLTSGSYGVNTIHTKSSIFNSNIYPGDFNGDGKTDLITIWNTNATIEYSTGRDWVTGENTINANFNTSSSHGFNISDMNGDGKSDLVNSYSVFVNGVASTSKIDVYFSKGLDFRYQSNTVPVISSYNDFVLGDFNGDGKTEIFNRDLYTSNSSIYYFNKDGKDFLLHKVKDGFGREIVFDYSWLSKGTNYTNGTISTFPVNDLAKQMAVVSSITTPNGIGGTSTLTYNYKGAKWHRQGKGFLGFNQVTTVNNTFGTTKISDFELRTDPFIPNMVVILLKKESEKLTSTGQLLAQVTYTNAIIGLGGVHIKIQPTNVLEENFLNTTSVTTTMTYDSYGNVLTTTKINGVETTTSTNTYTTFGTWWIPSRVASTVQSNTRTGEVIYTRQKNYTYNSFGLVSQEILDPSLSKSVILNFLYDNFGNKIQSTISSSGLPTKIQKVNYGLNGRFVQSTTNELNQQATVVTDKKWGKPLSETDISGLTTSYVYDGFGDMISTTDAKGITSSLIESWDITSGGTASTVPQNTLYSTITQKINAPYEKTWYDVLGRKVKSETQTQSQPVYYVQKFDQKGNVVSSTGPFYSGGTPIISANTYDQYNRPVTSNNGVSTTNYTYAASAGLLSTTIQNPSKTITKVIDASGQIVSSTDDGGTLNFIYYSNGMQKSVVMGGVTLVQSEYDNYKNQTKLIDKDGGTNLYDYNAYGQLISQTDANNVQSTLQYDNFGRLIQKTGGEGITTSTYVANGNGINLLKRVTSPNGVYIEYNYDVYDRLASEVEYVDGTTNTTTYTYNNSDQYTAMQYPSGYKIKMLYNAIGELVKITNDAGTVVMYDLPVKNQFGQLTSYKLGNGKTTNLAYSNIGMLTNITATGIQDYEINFNPTTGNLTSRKDYLKDKMEEFIFDESNRLIESKVLQMSNPLLFSFPLTVDYATNGNIMNKSNVGQYDYDDNKIHAVTNVENSNVIIPSLQQDITYTPFDRTASITEGDKSITFTYGPDLNRVKTQLYSAGSLIKTKYFIGSYEKEITPTGIKEIHYIPTGNNSYATYVLENGVGSYYYMYKDHLGSNVAITNSSGVVMYEQNFDAWGQRRNANNWSYDGITLSTSYSWVRGFTGHEQLDEFGLINMNNRMYDPIISRMLAVDNFIQDPYYTQNYNRYSYGYNNPLSFTDPSGEFLWAPIVIGAVAGAYIGGAIANNNGSPTEWNFSSGKTWGYMLGGAVTGAFSGAIGGAIAGSSVAFANTLGIFAGSSINSVGMAMLSGGTTDFVMSFGAASYNVNNQEWGYLGKDGNSKMQDLGYLFGGLANAPDVISLFGGGGNVTYNSLKMPAGHGSVTNPDGTISISKGLESGSAFWGEAKPWNTYSREYFQLSGTSDGAFHININNVNTKALKWMTKNVSSANDKGLLGFSKANYSLLGNTCASQSARSLFYVGVPCFGLLGPNVLLLQLAVRQIGIYASPYMIQKL